MFRYLSVAVSLLSACIAMGQSILVQPYLQDAEPTEMTIMWETSSGTQSLVEYGLSASLGSNTSGTAFTSSGSAQIHTVTLTGLAPATIYHYKTVTDAAESNIFHFKTPALASAEAETNIVAMSDMQQDGSHPNKFWEVVHNGVIEFVQDSMGPDLSEELAMVVIPGDLVATGSNYGSWKTTFFDPANPLFSYVPVYPVLGNHEQNTVNYFNYFQPPDNGTPGYEEHWWFKDHSNVRLIGLNSNSGYRIQAQLDWLDGVLADACTNDDIDFVFAQLHHPHESELWIAGNTSYTGDVIELMEQFSTDCGKPSIHFFGHTHGYSRGHSRDHSHVMVNVATAGGAIDNWGEFAQADYAEFSISQDEYGFVMVEVDAGPDPNFTLKRFSIGDQDVITDNTLEDLITIHRYGNAPMQPTAFFPTASDNVSPDCVILKGDPYFDADGEKHRDSHWQLSTSCGDWSAPIVDSWRQHQNWYYDIDTQAGDDLTDEEVSGLLPNTSYCWRVRYRDESLKWSEWSEPENFTTGTSSAGPNLLVNHDAENGITGWTATDGVIESLTAGECAGTSPYAGTYYFGLGALCTDNAYGRAIQGIDVSSSAVAIDAGSLSASYSGWFSDWNGSDVPAMSLEFRDGSNALLGTTPEIGNQTSTWTFAQNLTPIPVGTRTIVTVLTGTRNAGADNDSYIDELSVQLRTGTACSEPYVRPLVRTFLEGPFVQLDGQMHDDLRVQELIPLVEPFTSLGFNHFSEGGDETIDPIVLETTGPNAIVDWIMLELRTGTSSATVVATKSCLLQRDGDIVGLDGVSTPRITAVPGPYYLVMHHRNHLAVMTDGPIDFATTGTLIDLTNPATPIYGTEAMKDIGGTMAQWSGDVTHDGVIQYTGSGNDRDPILVEIGGEIPTAESAGYLSTDVNLDGIVKYTGASNDRDPILVNIGGVVPTAVRFTQVP